MSRLHIHFDPVGGAAGDMVIAALLDAFPELDETVRDAAEQLSGARCALLPHNDGVLSGKRFTVTVGPEQGSSPAASADLPGGLPGHGHDTRHSASPADRAGAEQDCAGGVALARGSAPPGGSAHHHTSHATDSHAHPDHPHLSHHHGGVPDAGAHYHDGAAGGHAHHGAGAHRHTHWRSIRAAIEGSTLSPAVKRHAVGIFTLLAEAEAQVHGIAVDDVAFHEVGNADSLADIVGAAALIEALGEARYSTGPLPLGSGLVATAHGTLPVPAPATALLLRDLPVIDDGIAGERVTPTGAAIVRYLQCGARPSRLILRRCGVGFGTRRLPGRSNCLRVLVFDAAEDADGDNGFSRSHDGDLLAAAAASAPSADTGGAAMAGEVPVPVSAGAAPHRTLLVISFEVDDQSAEDLALGLDRLRAMPAVHDALIMPAFGKKNRMTTHVQVLAAPDAEEEVIAACFAQTTTIGLRTQHVAARALPRQASVTEVDGVPVRLKTVRRPGGGTTVKAEAADLAEAATHASRTALRRRAEETAGGP